MRDTGGERGDKKQRMAVGLSGEGDPIQGRGGGAGSTWGRGVLTKIELLMLEWPLAGDCLEVVGDSF